MLLLFTFVLLLKESEQTGLGHPDFPTYIPSAMFSLYTIDPDISIGTCHKYSGRYIFILYIAPYSTSHYNKLGSKLGGFLMTVSKAQQAAVKKYMKANYDEIKIRVPKGRKAEIQAYAEAHDESLNGFINRLILKEMESDAPTD